MLASQKGGGAQEYNVRYLEEVSKIVLTRLRETVLLNLFRW